MIIEKIYFVFIVSHRWSQILEKAKTIFSTTLLWMTLILQLFGKNTNISVINILGRTEIKLFWKDLSDDIENRNGYEIHEPKKPQQGVRAEKEGFNSKRPQPNFTAVYCLFRFRIVVEVNGTACVLRKNILSIYKYDILYSLRIPFMHIMYFFLAYSSPTSPLQILPAPPLHVPLTTFYLLLIW